MWLGQPAGAALWLTVTRVTVMGRTDSTEERRTVPEPQCRLASLTPSLSTTVTVTMTPPAPHSFSVWVRVAESGHGPWPVPAHGASGPRARLSVWKKDININRSCAAQAMMSFVKIHWLRLILIQAGRLGPAPGGRSLARVQIWNYASWRRRWCTKYATSCAQA